MRKLLPIILTLFSALAWGQSSRYDNTVIGQNGVPVHNPTIRVCTNAAAAGSGTTLCTPLAPLGTDGTTVVGGRNPFTGDFNGNYHFYAIPNKYRVEVVVNGVVRSSDADIIVDCDPSLNCGSGGGPTSGINPGTVGQVPIYDTPVTIGSTNSHLFDQFPSLTYTGPQFSLGGAGTGTALFNLKGTTSGNVGFGVRDAAGTYTFLLPNHPPQIGQTLVALDVTGTMDWTTPSSGGGSGTVNPGTLNAFAYYSGTNQLDSHPRLSDDGSSFLLYSGFGGMKFTNSANAGIDITTTSDGAKLHMGGTSKLLLQSGSLSGAGQDVNIFGAPGSSTGFGGSVVIKAGSSTVNAAQTLSPGWVYLYGGTNTNSSGGGIQLAPGYGGATPYHVQIGCNSAFLFACTNGQVAITGVLDIVGKTQAGVALTVADSNPNYMTIKLPGVPSLNGQAVVSDNCPGNVCTWSYATISGGGGGTISGTLTPGRIPVAAGASLLGDSGFSDNGTTVSTGEILALQPSTAATNVANVNSPVFKIINNYWTGAASAGHTFSLQALPGSGSNPTESLTLASSGSAGTASFNSALLFTLSGGLTVSGGTVDMTAATKTAMFTSGNGEPAGGTCTLNGQAYFRKDAVDPGNPMRWCNGAGTWTTQTTSGGSSAWNSLTNAGGAMAVTVGNNTTAFTFGAATPAVPWLWTDTGSNTGTTALLQVTTAASSAASGMSITTQTAGVPLTLACGSTTCVALSTPFGQGTWKFNTLTSSSANPSATGSVRAGATDSWRYGCPGCNSALTSTGSTDMNVIAGNGSSGGVKVGDYLGIIIHGPISTFNTGENITISPAAATGAGNGGDVSIFSGAGAGVGRNGSIHLVPSTVGTGGAGWVDIGGSGLGTSTDVGDATNPPVSNGPVRVSTTGTIEAAQGNTSAIIGICVRNCAAGQVPVVIKIGSAACNFDGASVGVGHYVGPSNTSGLCTDLGTTPPSTSSTLGTVKALVAGSQYLIDVAIGSAPATTVGVVITSPTVSSTNTITAGNATTTPLTLIGAASQSAPLMTVKKSDLTSVFNIAADGTVTIAAGLGTITATQFLSTTTASATVGCTFCMAKTDKIAWQNNANTGTVLLGIDTSDSLLIPAAVPGTSAVLAFGTTNKVNFIVTNPAATRNITFDDPLANDAVVYKAATQTLSAKTISDLILTGSSGVTMTDISTPGNPAAGKTKFYTKGGTLCQLTPAGVETCGLGGGGGGNRLDQVSAATADATIDSTTKHITWNWEMDGSDTAMKFGEAIAATGASNILLNVQTLAGSTAVPFEVTAGGSANGVQVTTAGALQKKGTGSVIADAFSGQLPIANGGCAGTTAATCFNNVAPTTTLGDLIYANGTGTNTRLAGSTSATMAVLTQTGNGATSAAPAWVSTSGSGNFARVAGPALTGTTLSTAGAGNSVTLINHQAGTGSVTGNISGVTLYSTTITGGLIPAGGCILASVVFQHTTGTANVVYNWKYGSTSGNTMSSTNSASRFYGQMRMCNNVGVTNAQNMYTFQYQNGTTQAGGFSRTQPAEDSTINQTLSFIFTVQNTDAVTGEEFLVELIY